MLPIGKADGIWCKQFNSTNVERGYISVPTYAFMTCTGTKLPFAQIHVYTLTKITFKRCVTAMDRKRQCTV
jgi:hypothetical protein